MGSPKKTGGRKDREYNNFLLGETEKPNRGNEREDLTTAIDHEDRSQKKQTRGEGEKKERRRN